MLERHGISKLDEMFFRRWGFSLLGLGCKTKYVLNRLLRLPFKYMCWDIYEKWDVIRKPFPVVDCVFISRDGVLARGYDDRIVLVVSPDHEKYYREILVELLRDDTVFIDVGAHLGTYALRVARRCAKGMVIALEPDPRNYYYLIQNIMMNKLKNIIALPLAVYSESDRVLPFWFGRLSGESSLLRDWDVEKDMEIKVVAKKLDDIVEMTGVEKVDIIKIDVEGAEHYVLEGAINTLEKHHPVLLLEIHGKKQWEHATRLLSRLDYKLHILRISPLNSYHRNTIAYWKNDTRTEKIVGKYIAETIPS